MKIMKIMTMFVALATVLVFSSGVMAQQCPSTRGTGSMPLTKIEKSRGVLESVDRTNRSFVVNEGKRDMTFNWDEHTRIMQGKKTLSPTDLKQGEHLTLTYKEDGSKATANRIQVVSRWSGKSEYYN